MIGRRILSSALITLGILWLIGIALYAAVLMALPGALILLVAAAALYSPLQSLAILLTPILMIGGGKYLRRNLPAA